MQRFVGMTASLLFVFHSTEEYANVLYRHFLGKSGTLASVIGTSEVEIDSSSDFFRLLY